MYDQPLALVVCLQQFLSTFHNHLWLLLMVFQLKHVDLFPKDFDQLKNELLLGLKLWQHHDHLLFRQYY